MAKIEVLRDARGRILKGAPNPGGRPRMPQGAREAIHGTGVAAARKMRALLADDEAWGRDGWLDHRVQVRVLEIAMDRAFGRPEIVRAVAKNDAPAVAPETVMRTIANLCASLDEPEMRRSRKASRG